MKVNVRRIAVLAGVVMAAVAAGVVVADGASPAADADAGATARTATVTRTDLSATVTFTGALSTPATGTITNQRASGGDPGVVVQTPTPAVEVASSPGEAVSLSVAFAQVDDPTTTTTEPPTTTSTEPATTTTTEPATTTTSEPATTEPATTSTTAAPSTTTTTPTTTTTAPSPCPPSDEGAEETTVPDTSSTTTTIFDPATTTTTAPHPEPDPECPSETTAPGGPTMPGGGGRDGGAAPGGTSPDAAGAAADAGAGGAGGAGDQTVTWITGAGETLEHGDVAFGVDGLPTIVLYGDSPAWRDLSSDSEDGVDIEQLEAGLVMLGFASADDLTIDHTFDADTAAAIEAFQEAYGFEVDGTLELGDVLFLPASVTVTTSVQLGDAVSQGSEMLTVAPSGRSVSLEVDPAEAALLAAGTTVEVEVGGTTVAGTVVDVGREAVAASEDEDPTVAVEVSLTDPAVVAALPDGVGATITVTEESHAGVLAVPAGSLHAGADDGFAVTVVNAGGTDTEVPVIPGFESGGVVEIVEGEVQEGDLVAIG